MLTPRLRRRDIQQGRDGREGEARLTDNQEARHNPRMSHGPLPRQALVRWSDAPERSPW